MTTLTDDERWTQWCGWFEVAHKDISTLFHHRHVWVNIVAMLQNNAQMTHHSTVNDWLIRGYTQTLAVGIRRQSQYTDRRPTLGRLLSELERHPQVASRERYLALADDPAVAAPFWHGFAASSGEHIDPDQVHSDLEAVKTATTPARDWVNRRIAHRDQDVTTGPISVTFGDLDAGLDRLGTALKEYWGLFHPAAILQAVTPLPGLGWTEMFAVPWKPPNFASIDAWDLG